MAGRERGGESSGRGKLAWPIREAALAATWQDVAGWGRSRWRDEGATLGSGAVGASEVDRPPHFFFFLINAATLKIKPWLHMLLLEVPITNPSVCVENQVIVAALLLGTCSSTSCPEPSFCILDKSLDEVYFALQ